MKGVFMSKRKRKITRKSIKNQILEDYKKHLDKFYTNKEDCIREKVPTTKKIPLQQSLIYKSVKPKLYKQSYGESVVEQKLRKYNISFLKEVEFNGLINPATKKKLRFDFYLPELNICIEFDGEQHFKTIKEFDGDDITLLPKRRFLDKLKNNFCKSNNIKLIRIKYTEINNINKIIKHINE